MNFKKILLPLLVLQACSSPDNQTLAPHRATSRPYRIKGIWYTPQQDYEHEETGIASWYGGRDGCHGLPTASGQKFDMYTHSAAHKTLPLPCVIRITNLQNGRQIDLKVNDRGPFKFDRILDVSVAAAQALGFYGMGTAPVHIRTLVSESLALPENQPKARRKQTTPPTQTICSLDQLCAVVEAEQQMERRSLDDLLEQGK